MSPRADEPIVNDSSELILGRLGTLLLDAGVSVTDVRSSLESISPEPRSTLTFSVLPEMVIVGETKTGAVAAACTTEAELSFKQAARANRIPWLLQTGAIGLADAAAQIREVRSINRRHPGWEWVGGSCLVSFGLAILFRCPWWAILVALVVGGVVGLIGAVMKRQSAAASIMPFVAAFVSTALVGAFAEVSGMDRVPLYAVCAPIAILVPGALITNALLELTSTDIITGSARLSYGLIVLGFMTLGLVAGGALTGLHLDPGSAGLVGQIRGLTGARAGWEALPPLWLSWVSVGILAIGVGIAFGSGLKLTVLSIVMMTCTYALLTVLDPITGKVVSTGIAAAALLFLSRLIARWSLAVPAAVSFQPAFLLLVPGTVGLIAFVSLDVNGLATALETFASLCIGAKVGALVASVIERPQRRDGS